MGKKAQNIRLKGKRCFSYVTEYDLGNVSVREETMYFIYSGSF